MTAPLPGPPPLVRARLRLRWARRRAVWAVARALREVAERLDPPAELLARGIVERDASQARHPSTTGALPDRSTLRGRAPLAAVPDGLNLGPRRPARRRGHGASEGDDDL